MQPIIFMGLNTDPEFTERSNIATISEENQQVERRRIQKALDRKTEIENAMETNDQVQLSWSCDGRMRHSIHATNWSKALPQFFFFITENYGCYVFKTEEKREEFKASGKYN